MGMMPTHTLWRLTSPIYIALLPLVGFAFIPIVKHIPRKFALIAVLFCLLHQSFKLPNAPIFVTDEIFQSGKSLQEVVEAQNASPNEVLIEVFGWEWMPIAFLGAGPEFLTPKYDRNTNLPMIQQNNDQINPSIFQQSQDEIRQYLESNNIQIAAVASERARKTLMTLGWRAAQPGRYIIFTRP